MKRLSALTPERFSRIHLTEVPEPRFHRNPAKPRGLSDSCAEPVLKGKGRERDRRDGGVVAAPEGSTVSKTT